MKTILCYGDSNTWGWVPGTGERFPKAERWPGVLQDQLGDEFEVIEEGLPGRTTVWDDPIEGYKNGKEYLIPCLESHKPLDLVIIMLGTNDLKVRFSLSAYDISEGVNVLAKIVQKCEVGPSGNSPQLLILVPPPLGRLSGEGIEICEGGEEKSKLFSHHYQRVAELLGCPYFDTSKVIKMSDIDGGHIESSEHKKLGVAVAEIVSELL